MQQSEKLPGNAQNFIIKNDIVYVLSVLYDKNSKRTVGIYSLDINSLKVIELIEIPGLTFAFYLREMNGVLEIYGNKNEEAKDLTIYTHDISNKKTNLIVNSDIPVMWISKVIDTDKKEIILNDYSIVSLDKYKIPKVEFENNKTLIDMEYRESDKSFYVLSGDFEKNEFEVDKLNENFDIIESIPLSIEEKKPTDLLLK
ncbi:hypothetical protein [Lysinibacillus boronitolerans]|uniref:hypothetical protein n=1 Tax=Lysinibacillus boronitolerans TaxID=309788 RepID=UPI0038528B23